MGGGSRQIAAYLPQSRFSAGRHRIRRLMGIMGLQAIYKGPNTSKKHPQHRIYPYLLRGLAVTRPNQVWCRDITYIPVKRGFLYLVALMDWATRKVLSWRLSNTLPYRRLFQSPAGQGMPAFALRRWRKLSPDTASLRS